MPLRDDWAPAAELIRRLDRVIPPQHWLLDVLLIDDASMTPCVPADFQFDSSSVRTVRTLRLRRNLGHQRAIGIGFVYVAIEMPCDAVVVMDADGEDTAEGVAELLRAFDDTGREQAVFAERIRRSEGVVFRLFYWLYRQIHWILTGIGVRVGNFSVLPYAYLDTLIVLSEIWNHYAAALFRSKLPFKTVPIARGVRISGQSRMNFGALVAHGLSAISVFGEIVGVRVLLVALGGSLLAAAGILVVVLIRLFTDYAIPGWATYAGGILAIIVVQLVTLAATFTLFVLSNRASVGFIPLRDYKLFIARTADLFRHE
jgi:hypothetical protein